MSAPSRLGRYPVRRRIGAGAFATVWLAYDEHLDSPVAIKVLADNWTEDLHIRQRFLEEGRFLRKVESPHVVTVYDAGELADGRPYLVMAYADQGTLADRLELGSLDRGQAVHVISQVGRGLSALHDRGVLHRDVKPANVLFRTIDAGRAAHVVAMVGDLGLGKAMDMSSRLTMIGGTPTYVAPEQAAGQALDARADQFSLAALTYVLLAGRQPFDHRTLAAAEDPAPPPPMGIDNAAAEAVVRRGLAKDRKDRFDEITDFTAALAEAMGEAPGQVPGQVPPAWIPVDAEPTQAGRRPEPTALADSELPPVPTLRGRGRRLPLLVAGVLALALGAGAGWATGVATTTERTLEDATGTVSVTVPTSWSAHVAPDQWTPATGDSDFPSLAAGTTAAWNAGADPAPGVFVGILEGVKLPSQVPQHPDCESAGTPVIADEQRVMTVVFTECRGVAVTVERVERLADNRLLWVQVRSNDRGTANRVLDSVEVFGMGRT
ncbi:MAG: serine/threonine protein kinase [Nocardioides sp.]|nr:serine/threonine protein kinase [Nocardioides sp.]